MMNFTNCDREQVQFLGAIMPHGVLLVLSLHPFSILGVSANAHSWLGVDVDSLLNGHLGQIVAADVRQTLEDGLASLTEPFHPKYFGCFQTLQNIHRFDVFAHRSGDVILLEFEAIPPGVSDRSATERFADVSECIAALQSAETWQEGMSIAVRELKRLSGFDSVIGVRFLADGSFHAMAEACEEHFASFLDKRFPRSDIPEPGRKQMILMPLQYGPDLTHEPVPLVMAEQQLKPLKIDLGLSVLRSISRMCNRFYLNMGVHSRLVLSLVDRGELWGFFNCKNATPRYVAYSDRLAFQSFAKMAAMLLVEKEKSEQDKCLLESMRNITEIAAELSSIEAFPTAFRNLPARSLEKFDIGGSALCNGQHIISAGVTPDNDMIKALLPWLDGQVELFVTDRLLALFEPAAQDGDSATGLIAMRLMEPRQYLLVFRPEWVHEVHWAGDPRKPVEMDASSGEERLTARGSFEVWKEDVRGRARPWQAHEIEAMADLQRVVILSQHADKQRALQSMLEASNVELEDFAYIVSHDLQEPLRGIRNFTQFLENEVGERLEPQQRGWLDTIMKMGVRMSNQIDAMLQYSRAGQLSLDRQSVDINKLLQAIIDDLSVGIGLTGTKIEILKHLPTVMCDPIRTAAVLENLIVNAIKYNDKAEKQVEIGCLEGIPTTFFVRDNGIGIAERHHEAIFTIFRRLHGRTEFGGGTGAGLTIARKHIERQGGRLWLESTVGLGSSFYFTLGF